jgi:predicted kinase
MTRRPLILSGGPAVGKSVTARVLAQGREKCAFIDVDDVRQLVVAGGAAPWQGSDGRDQQRLGVANACALARNFVAAGFEVIVVDVLTPKTCDLYRRDLPECVVVHMTVTWPEAMRRAASRKVWLTDDEFRMLHESDSAHPPDSDYRISVDALTIQSQADEVEELWRRHAART